MCARDLFYKTEMCSTENINLAVYSQLKWYVIIFPTYLLKIFTCN